MNEIKVECVQRQSRHDGLIWEICIFIDGVNLIELARIQEEPFAEREGTNIAGGYVGLRARYLKLKYFLGDCCSADTEEHKVALLGCDCGISGCWDFCAKVEVTDDRVIWRDFEQPHRNGRWGRSVWTYEGFGPFVFDRTEYERQFKKIEEHYVDPKIAREEALKRRGRQDLDS